MSYRETNSVPAEMLLKLSEFIRDKMPSDKFISVDFFEETIKRHIDIYVLIYFSDSEDGLFHFDTEEANAALLLWEYGDFVDTSDLEKECFVREHGFYKFKWFYPESEAYFYDSNKIKT